MGTAPHITFDIAAFNQKDVSAYNHAFKFYYPALCDFAGRLVGADTAEDIVEDLFLKVWTSTQEFKDTDHFKAFLYHAIKNAALDVLKKDRRATDRHLLYTEWQEKDEANYLAGIIRAEVVTELYAAIAELPKGKGGIIKMTYLEGKSNQETADELGLSVQTVKNQKLRGLALLRKKLPDGAFVLLFLYPLFY
jgi:RNA polymerase sigma-70 factor (family 1)